MKRLISLFIVIVLISVSIQTFAFDWKKFDADQTNRIEDGNKTILILKDKQKNVFKVIYQDETMMANFADKIISLKNEFYAWHKIKVKEVNFLVIPNLLEMVIIPQEIKHNQVNLASNLPAGMMMVYDPEKDLIHYDFRIMKEDLFIRIVGEYHNEDELESKICYVYDNPLEYMQIAGNEGSDGAINLNGGNRSTGSVDIRDERIRRALIYLNNENWNGRQKPISQETINRIVEIKQNYPDITKKQLWKMLKKDKVKLTKRELDLVLIIYFNEFE